MHSIKGREGRTVDVLPVTRRGRYAVALLIAFVVLGGFFVLLIAGGQRGGPSFFSNLWLTAPFLAAVTCAMAAGVMGALAIIRDRERALLVFVAVLVGAVLALFVAAELAFPH